MINLKATKGLLSLTGLCLLGFSVVGMAAPPRLYFPFPTGQSWYVCQGYNGSVSHTGTRASSLDLSSDLKSVASGTNCAPSTANSSKDKTVIAPDNGTVAWIGTTTPDIMCLNLDSGGSIKLGHFYSKVAGGKRVIGNSTILGTLNAAGTGSNGGYAHIHMQLFKGKGCIDYDYVGFDSAFGLPALLYNSKIQNQWRGTTFTKR